MTTNARWILGGLLSLCLMLLLLTAAKAARPLAGHVLDEARVAGRSVESFATVADESSMVILLRTYASYPC